MARTKEFDPDAALQRALELFWERGYEATSMADLVEHLGVARASIYATFGGKHELYLKALERYVRVGDPASSTALSQPGPALPAVRALVERVRRRSRRATSDRRGCMVVNTAVELAPHDPRDGPAGRGELGPPGDRADLGADPGAGAGRAGRRTGIPRALARFLLVLLQGMRVLGQGGRPDPSACVTPPHRRWRCWTDRHGGRPRRGTAFGMSRLLPKNKNDRSRIFGCFRKGIMAIAEPGSPPVGHGATAQPAERTGSVRAFALLAALTAAAVRPRSEG